MGVLCDAELSSMSALRLAVSRLALRASSEGFLPSFLSPISVALGYKIESARPAMEVPHGALHIGASIDTWSLRRYIHAS